MRFHRTGRRPAPNLLRDDHWPLPPFASDRYWVRIHVLPTTAGALPDLDQSLLAAGRGDRQAFADVYDAISGAVFGVIRKVLRDPAMSEEVAQDVLLEVWRTAPRFDPERGKASTWILTIAHRRAIDRVRAEQAGRDRIERVGIAEHTPAYDSTAAAVEHADDRRRVARALDVTTDLQREAIELAYYEGLTYRQVADELGVPLGTVKTRMRDGLLRMREALSATA